MDDNENNSNEETVNHYHTNNLNASAGAVIVFVILSLILGFAAIYFAQRTPENSQVCKDSEILKIENKKTEQTKEKTQQIQLLMSQSQADAAKSSADRDLTIRMKVIENCEKKGNTPVYLMGNVYCSKSGEPPNPFQQQNQQKR